MVAAVADRERRLVRRLESNRQCRGPVPGAVLHAQGGDLHNHLSGAAFPEWWYDAALAEKARGYEYYTKVRIENCRDYGGNEYGGIAYYLMFRNIMAIHYEQLSDCEKREYKRLENLTDDEKAAWLNSILLDKPHEGRDEFFQTHWQRLFALLTNPWIQAEIMYRNMQAFSEEGVTYIEFQVADAGFQNPDGSVISPQKNDRHPARAAATKRRYRHRRNGSLPDRNPEIPAERRRRTAAGLSVRL